MQISDVMTKRVQVVPRSMNAEDAWTLMRQKRIHHLVVTDGKHLEGIASTEDFGGKTGEAIRKGRTVGDLMQRNVVTVPPGASTKKVANLMRGRTIGSAIVTESGHIVGIVTVSDLLELLGRGGERGVDRGKRWTLKHRVPHEKKRSATGTW